MQVEPVRLPTLLRGLGLLLVVPLLVVALVGATYVAQRSTPRRPSDPVPPAAAGVTAQRLTVQRAVLDDVTTAAPLVRHAAHGRRVARAGRPPVLVLSARGRPYGLGALLRHPRVTTMLGHRELLVRNPIVVTEGARLTLRSGQVSALLLKSSPEQFASLVGLGSSIRLSGTPSVPLEVTSYERGRHSPDVDIDDGRPFVLNLGGRMELRHVHADSLGFGEGLASGVAWVGAKGSPAHGDVTHSTFTRNRFGAYTARARGMTWSHNTFAHNQAYGFDPHDFSNHFVVRDNVAHHNGRHGIIFSRGCRGNLISGNLSQSNGGHGFMIDDGRSGVTSGPHRMAPSSHNLLNANRALDNGHSGIEVEGGRRNVVRDNEVSGNFIGVRYRDGAAGDVEANDIGQNALYGIEVEADAGLVTVVGNTAGGSWSDLTVARRVRLGTNRFAVVQARSTADGHRQLGGVLVQASRFLEFRPAAIAWLVVLLVPAAALVGRARRRTRETLRRPGDSLESLRSAEKSTDGP